MSTTAPTTPGISPPPPFSTNPTLTITSLARSLSVTYSIDRTKGKENWRSRPLKNRERKTVKEKVTVMEGSRGGDEGDGDGQHKKETGPTSCSQSERRRKGLPKEEEEEMAKQRAKKRKEENARHMSNLPRLIIACNRALGLLVRQHNGDVSDGLLQSSNLKSFTFNELKTAIRNLLDFDVESSCVDRSSRWGSQGGELSSRAAGKRRKEIHSRMVVILRPSKVAVIWRRVGEWGAGHRDGDYHRAVYVCIYAESTQELLLRKHADCKNSWPGLWDISSAGHISAGDSSLISARRALEEELGIVLPKDAFELIFNFLRDWTTNNGTFISNEFDDVYLVTTLDPIPLEAFTLQESEVSAVKYLHYNQYRSLLAKEDPDYAPYDVDGQYGQLFDIIEQRYKENTTARCLALQKQIERYASVTLNLELRGLSEGDTRALVLIIKAARVMDEISHQQVWHSNPALRDWLKEHAATSELDRLKWVYYSINKSPWSCLDESEAFLTTADSAVKLLSQCSKPVSGREGLEYKAAFPKLKPPGANFYPPDKDKMHGLPKDQLEEVTGFFNVIKRRSELSIEASMTNLAVKNHDNDNVAVSGTDLYNVPYCKEYMSSLSKAAELLLEAGNLTSSTSLKRLLHEKAKAFLSNDYYESDIAWMELDSKLDVTIGPYETYEDALFGYKATFEAFVGIRDDNVTAQIIFQLMIAITIYLILN
ncbi:hypothetical protein CRG98_033226 [Punica granatum]|uniref:Nudix hydrolase domain-containing protein n=1 Tax=Punica granatum TaxID=22663 RepID=A0A2I0IQX0_PUNGR|nr:hypothetical protein CRG98_033226 [Punica granatum]